MVVGGGNELNLACDLAVAADDIAIRHVGPSRGSLPAGGATQWLPITIGDRRAREMLFLNRPVRAPKALEWGLVNRCVSREQLDMEVDNLSHELLAKLPETLRATKAWTHFWKDLSWGLTIRPAREWLTVHAASAEVRAGLESFRDKRLPDYGALREATAVAGGGPRRDVGGDAAGARPAFCPGCGSAVEPDFRFCPACGSALVAAGEGGIEA
jgi:enoyl-CoA hydratase/carnithine racemase